MVSFHIDYENDGTLKSGFVLFSFFVKWLTLVI